MLEQTLAPADALFPDSVIGHNAPPPDANPIRDRLVVQYADLTSRRDALLAAADRAPEVIEDDETAGRIGDFVKQIQACGKTADTARVAEKAPYLEGGKTVDGWFKGITDPLATAKTQMERRLSAYLKKKADDEARRRQEEAARAAAERAKAEEEARAAAAAMQTDADLSAALSAEEEARAKAKDEALAAKATAATAADLSRTRGDYGSTTSLRAEWTFRDLDRTTVDLESLRPYLPMDGLEKAVRAFIRAGGRSLTGVVIEQDFKAAVR